MRSVTIHLAGFRSTDEGGFDCNASVLGNDNLNGVIRFSNGLEEVVSSPYFDLIKAFVMGISASTGNPLPPIHIALHLPEEPVLRTAIQALDWESNQRDSKGCFVIIPLFVTTESREAVTCQVLQPLKMVVLIADQTGREGSETEQREVIDVGDIVGKFGKVEGADSPIVLPALFPLPDQIRSADVVAIVAHGSKPTVGRPSGVIWLNDPEGGHVSVTPQELGSMLDLLGSECPPVICLISCSLADANGTAGRAESTFAEVLLRETQEVRLITAYTAAVPPRRASEVALNSLRRLSSMKAGESLGKVMASHAWVEKLPLRIFSKGAELQFRRKRHGRVLVTDIESVNELRNSIAGTTPPIFVIGSGFFTDFDETLDLEATNTKYPLKGWPRRDPSEITAALGNQDRVAFRKCANRLFATGGAAPVVPAGQPLDLFASLKLPVIFNLNRSTHLYKALLQNGITPKVFFTSPRVPVLKDQQRRFDELLALASNRDTRMTLLFQPFGLQPDKEVAPEHFFDYEQDFGRSQKKRDMYARDARYYATQIDLLEWLCPIGGEAPLAGIFPSLLAGRMRDPESGLAFLGVAPDLLETKVFITWLSSQITANQQYPQRVYVQTQPRAFHEDCCENQQRAREHLVSLLRYYLVVQDNDFREIGTKLDDTLAELRETEVAMNE